MPLLGKRHHEASNWINHGGDLHNRRYAAKEYKISPDTVSKLQLKWTFYAGKDITATPAIYDGTIYLPSWNGFIYAVKQCDGSLVWKQSLHELTGLNATGFVPNVTGPVSRSTPTIAGKLLIVGLYGPAIVMALKRETGKLVWSTRLDNHPAAVITMSGTFDKGGLFVGISSLEEGLSIEECCTFRGSFAKLNARTGAIVWQTFMLPDNNGSRGEYAGAAVWGSSPSIDINRNQVYIATGNLYSAPERILQCQEQENNQTVPTHPDQCVEPDNHSESMLALDLDSGEIEWYKQLGGYDVWFVACNNLSTPDCPPGPNPDADFGEAPMMLSSFINGTERDLLAAVQKSGFAWVLDRDNGNIIWTTEAGPGSTGGGGIWGAATDERRIYTNIANGDQKNFTLKPSNKNTTAGGWVAMDASTGIILWSTANPSNALASGPVTVANNVLFGGSMYKTGPLYAMHAGTGEILWSYETGASVFGGVSVSEGCIYVGSGYTSGIGSFTPSNTGGTSLFAFYRSVGKSFEQLFAACYNLSSPNCPPGPNPDADFGEAPMMLSAKNNGTRRDLVAAIQKSGFAWVLDRNDGSLIWSTEAGPGGIGGGTWGAATDERRIYTNIANSDRKNFTLLPSNKNTTSGGWVAMDARTGKTLWSTANPSNATANGPVTVVNNVLFAGSTNVTGPLYAMNAKTGKILWSYETGASVYGGVSVNNGCVYVGSGFKLGIWNTGFLCRNITLCLLHRMNPC
ncbi:Pyrrolo-quinoline quinone repeat [Dillenia turbinata]|uniref:Pyrrolo-quinoline quinone repeat n=1 Tax=Dillenia turbinata TaxID=194707 RepID=A0AAN8YUU0_9MAGN